MAFRPHWINPNYFLVRINKIEQQKKREMIGDTGLFMPHTAGFMGNNMQYGEVVMIGDDDRENELDWYEANIKNIPAQKLLPQAQPGDDLLFSHFIEGSLEDVEGNDEYLIESDEEFNYYMVPIREVYAVAKKDGTIFVKPDVIFAAVDETETNEDVFFNGKIFLYNNYKTSTAQWQSRIDELKETLSEMQYTPGSGNHQKAIAIQEEMERLSGELRKRRIAMFKPLIVNEKFNRDCGRKITESDVLYYEVLGANNIELQSYDLDYRGRKFIVLKPSHVVMVSNGEPLKVVDEKLYVTENAKILSL